MLSFSLLCVSIELHTHGNGLSETKAFAAKTIQWVHKQWPKPSPAELRRQAIMQEMEEEQTHELKRMAMIYAIRVQQKEQAETQDANQKLWSSWPSNPGNRATTRYSLPTIQK